MKKKLSKKDCTRLAKDIRKNSIDEMAEKKTESTSYKNHANKAL